MTCTSQPRTRSFEHRALLGVALALALGIVGCSRKGSVTSGGAVPAGSTTCVHPLTDLSEDQRAGKPPAATAAALREMQGGGASLVACPLDGAAIPKVTVARCGGVTSVAWSTGLAGATSFFDVSGNLVGYQEATERPEGYTCGDGKKTHVNVYGGVPTCAPWSDERYCAPPSEPSK